MLYLITNTRDVEYIFNSQDATITGIASRAIEKYSERPCFFTPYRNVAEFVGEVIAPVVYPLAGFALAALSPFAAALATTIAIGSLLTSVLALCCGNTAFAKQALDFAGSALKFAGVALLTSVTAAVLGILSIPHSAASLVTRTGASIAAVTTGYDDGYESPNPEDEESYSCF